MTERCRALSPRVSGGGAVLGLGTDCGRLGPGGSVTRVDEASGIGEAGWHGGVVGRRPGAVRRSVGATGRVAVGHLTSSTRRDVAVRATCTPGWDAAGRDSAGAADPTTLTTGAETPGAAGPTTLTAGWDVAGGGTVGCAAFSLG